MTRRQSLMRSRILLCGGPPPGMMRFTFILFLKSFWKQDRSSISFSRLLHPGPVPQIDKVPISTSLVSSHLLVLHISIDLLPSSIPSLNMTGTWRDPNESAPQDDMGRRIRPPHCAVCQWENHSKSCETAHGREWKTNYSVWTRS